MGRLDAEVAKSNLYLRKGSSQSLQPFRAHSHHQKVVIWCQEQIRKIRSVFDPHLLETSMGFELIIGDR